MSIGKRNRAWPLAIALSIAVVGVLAAFIVMAVQEPAPATAHGPDICHTPFAEINPDCAAEHPHTDDTTPSPGPVTPATGDMIKSDSKSGGGAPEFQVKIQSLPKTLAVGSSIVLYLEDDYQQPATIPTSSVYFVATPPTEETGSGARVYTTIAPKIDTDAYFDADKSDISIRVFIPDMCTSSTDDCQGQNGVDAGQTLTMVVEDTSGIKNPTEAGSHSAAFAILDPTDSVPGPDAVDKDYELPTVAEVKLSDVNNSRGYELVVIGSGYNDGTTATAYTLAMPTAAPVVGFAGLRRDDNSRRHDPQWQRRNRCRQPVLQDVHWFDLRPDDQGAGIICRASSRIRARDERL